MRLFGRITGFKLLKTVIHSHKAIQHVNPHIRRHTMNMKNLSHFLVYSLFLCLAKQLNCVKEQISINLEDSQINISGGRNPKKSCFVSV